jgi:hypothetical protein
MHETPVSFLQVDAPATGAVLPPGRHAVQGWLMPKLGGGFADLRARIDDRVFPAQLGLPRADLAAHFSTGRAYEFAGFQVDVVLAAGARRLVFEALQVEGIWLEIGALDVAVDGARPPVDYPVPTAPVRGPEFGHLLHALLTATGPDADLPALARRIVAETPFPRDVLRPKPPFHGSLAAPMALTASPDGLLEIHGHLFHAGARIRQLSVSVDLQARQPLRHGEPTPDVAAAHPRYASARACGYAGTIFVPARLPNPVALRLYAELADDTLHLVQVARVHRRDAADLTRPFNPALAARFDEAVAALRRALAERHLALVTDEAYRKDVARLFSLRAAPPPRLARALHLDLEETFAHADGERRRRAGLPENGWVIAALAEPSHPVVPALLGQVEAALHRRHPALAGTCRFVPAGPPAPSDEKRLPDDEIRTLADLTIRPAAPDDEFAFEADPVLLAEAIARRLYRRTAVHPAL